MLQAGTVKVSLVDSVLLEHFVMKSSFPVENRPTWVALIVVAFRALMSLVWSIVIFRPLSVEAAGPVKVTTPLVDKPTANAVEVQLM